MVRPRIVGKAAFTTARPSGLSAFRFTLDAELVNTRLGGLPEILQSDKPVCLTMVYSFDGSMRSIVMYPCRNFQLLNFVCITPSKNLKNGSTESWSASGDKEEMLSIFEDFPAWSLDLLR